MSEGLGPGSEARQTMQTVGGEYRLTVKQLRELLDKEPDDAIVLVDRKGPDGSYSTHSIYKTACAADGSFLFLYSGSEWPKRGPNA